MKIYKLNPDKSNLKWSSKIGDHEIHGMAKIQDGNLISEMGEVIEGNISVDLRTLNITDTALSQDQQESLEKAINSSPFMKEDQSLAYFKFEEVLSDNDHDVMKGLLMIGNQAFGLDINTKFNQSGNDLITKGETQIQKSNFVFIEELEHLFEDTIEKGKSIESFDVECELFASAS